jgi:hypothetical protein
MTRHRARGQISLRKVANTEIKLPGSRRNYGFFTSSPETERRLQSCIQIVKIVKTIILCWPLILRAIEVFHREISRYWKIVLSIFETFIDWLP